MEKIRKLGKYQKTILALIVLMVLVFTAVYAIVTQRNGFLYRDKIMMPKQGENETVYSAQYGNQVAKFTVKKDKSVVFTYMDILWGPYVIKEDTSAIPRTSEIKDMLTGFELYCDGERIYRGSFAKIDQKNDVYWICDENGILQYASDNPVFVNEDDDMVPLVSDIVRLTEGPVLTHKGNIVLYVLGLFISLLTAVSIIFAEELFRRRLSYLINRPEDAEPSEWEITGRYIAWTIGPIIALVSFITGLK